MTLIEHGWVSNIGAFSKPKKIWQYFHFGKLQWYEKLASNEFRSFLRTMMFNMRCLIFKSKCWCPCFYILQCIWFIVPTDENKDWDSWCISIFWNSSAYCDPWLMLALCIPQHHVSPTLWYSFHISTVLSFCLFFCLEIIKLCVLFLSVFCATVTEYHRLKNS